MPLRFGPCTAIRKRARAAAVAADAAAAPMLASAMKTGKPHKFGDKAHQWEELGTSRASSRALEKVREAFQERSVKIRAAPPQERAFYLPAIIRIAVKKLSERYAFIMKSFLVRAKQVCARTDWQRSASIAFEKPYGLYREEKSKIPSGFTTYIRSKKTVCTLPKAVSTSLMIPKNFGRKGKAERKSGA